MRVSFNELKKFVNLEGLTPEEVADRLTFSGTEVEEITHLSQGTNLVIGHIISCEEHPDSDHLHILKVDEGKNYGVVQIVCGAPNARKDLKVIVARIGAKLKDGEIKPATIRGVDSSGMCCSLSELGVDKKYLTEKQLAGIEELPADAPIGEENVLAYLGIDDTILDIKVLANRPDLLSIYNVAREVGALFKREVNIPTYIDKGTEKGEYDIQINCATCTQFALKQMVGITNGDSPKWMQSALMSMGIRSINALVDIGNYVMLLTGQPLHMYDADKLAKKTMVVCDDKKGDFVALDDKTYELNEGDITICNNDHVMCLGGIMGAKECETDLNTKNIIIEAASFNGKNVRLTSQRLGLSSESSQRFIKGTNHFQAENVLALTASFVNEICHATKEYKIANVSKEEQKDHIIVTSLEKINGRLGTEFKADEVRDTLNALFFECKEDGDKLIVKVPSFRLDVEGDADISEEVIRYLGYSNVKSKLPNLHQTVGKRSGNLEKVDVIENFLVNHGLDECLTYTLINKKDENEFAYLLKGEAYTILNPLTEDHQTVRKAILPSLINSAIYNFSRQNRNLAMFEISDLITKNERAYALAIVLANEKENQHLMQTEKYDFYHLKGIVEEIMVMFGVNEGRYRLEKNDRGEIKELHPGRSALIKIGRDTIGYFGQLHPSYAKAKGVGKNNLLVLEMNLNALFALKTGDIKMAGISKFPSVIRDFAFVCKKKVLAKDIISEIKRAGKGIVTNVEVFDIYTGENVAEDEKSIALKITYSSFDATLKEQEIKAAEDKILDVCKLKFGAILRG